MNCWTLSNIILPINCKKFQALTTEFAAACAQHWQSPVKTEITLYKAVKHAPLALPEPEDIAWINAYNDSITLLKTGNPSAITPAVWDTARQAVVALVPVDKESAPSCAAAYLSFKGHFDRTASYHVQSDSKDIRAAILSAHKFMKKSDGYRYRATHG